MVSGGRKKYDTVSFHDCSTCVSFSYLRLLAAGPVGDAVRKWFCGVMAVGGKSGRVNPALWTRGTTKPMRRLTGYTH